MKTIDYIGLISSLIGIIAAVWAVITFLFKPYFKRKEELSSLKELIDSEYTRWKEFGVLGRAETEIMKDKFVLVDKYRNKLKNISSDKLLYLFHCSLQNGIKGNWGKWLNFFPISKELILLLINGLSVSNNLRPSWRRAFILENILKGQSKFIKMMAKERSELDDLVDAICSGCVEEYLQNLSLTSHNENIKMKINSVLQEMKYYKKDIITYSENLSQYELKIIINSISYE